VKKISIICNFHNNLADQRRGQEAHSVKGIRRGAQRALLGYLSGKDYLGGLARDGRIILN